jgi:hypothetical protein
MDVYQVTFVVLVLGSGYVAYHHHKDDIWSQESSGEEGRAQTKNPKIEASATQFKKVFIPVYMLVMGSDWLQVCDRPPPLSNKQLTNVGPFHIHVVQR